MTSPSAPRNMLPLLIGEGKPPDRAMAAFLRSAVSPVDPHAGTGGMVDGFSVQFGDTRFSCFRTSPARIAFGGGHALRFFFPYQGQIQVAADQAVHDLTSGMDAGLYRPPVSEIIAFGNASFVCVEVDRQRLLNTAMACRDVDQKAFFVRLEHALNAGGLALQEDAVGFSALRHYFRHLTHYISKTSLGLSLGLEELFYRYLVLLVFHRDPAVERPRGPQTKEQLAALQDAIYAHPAKRFTLAEMSESAGMSARALQKLIMSTYGVTPIEWQIGLRLDDARARLQSSKDKITSRLWPRRAASRRPPASPKDTGANSGSRPARTCCSSAKEWRETTKVNKKFAKRTGRDFFWIALFFR